jgi:FAD binding domain/Berberine and berberine like
MTEILTLNGTRTTVNVADIAALREGLRGAVILAGDPAYEQARRVWNGNVDRKPALIARCDGVTDIQRAVAFASGRGLLLSVRGGGHSAPGYGTNDGGMVIDLSLMKDVTIDPAARTARVEPGVLWREMDAAAQVHGLATTGGTVSNTGVIGLTLGGGLGWLMGKHGLTVDNVLSANVVTADGRSLTASAAENTDLFWALRGGGGNFGIVTSMTFRLHPVTEVLGGLVLYPLDQAGAMLRHYRDICPTLPDEAEAYAGVLTSPDGIPIGAMILGYNGPIAEGEKVLAPLRQFGTPIADMVGPVPYGARQIMLDAPNAEHGLHRYWRAAFTETISDGLIDTMVEGASRFSSPLSAMLFFYMHGAAARVPAEDTAFSARRAQWDFDAIGQWVEGSESPVHIGWLKDIWGKLEPHLKGSVYINHVAADDGVEKIRASYGTNHQRLRTIKAKYDPANLFRVNANIPPA